MTSPPTRRPSVRLTPDEAWAVLDRAHTGIFTTLRADGWPITLPVWFVTLDRRVYLSTRGKKVSRVRRDERCSFLVESGEGWAELRAVHLTGVARVVEDDPALQQRVADAVDAKYRDFRPARRQMADDTRQFYERQARSIIELIPDERILSWDNRRAGPG
jgi:hypothetical protein